MESVDILDNLLIERNINTIFGLNIRELTQFESGATTGHTFISSAVRSVPGIDVEKLRAQQKASGTIPTNFVSTRPKCFLRNYYDKEKICYSLLHFKQSCGDLSGEFISTGALGSLLDNVTNGAYQIIKGNYAFTKDLELTFIKDIVLKEHDILISRCIIESANEDMTRATLRAQVFSLDESILFVECSCRVVNNSHVRVPVEIGLLKVSPLIVELRKKYKAEELYTEEQRTLYATKPIDFKMTKEQYQTMLEIKPTKFSEEMCFINDFRDLFKQERNSTMFDNAINEYFDCTGPHRMVDYHLFKNPNGGEFFGSFVASIFARGPPPNLHHGGSIYTLAGDFTSAIARIELGFFCSCENVYVKYVSPFTLGQVGIIKDITYKLNENKTKIEIEAKCYNQKDQLTSIWRSRYRLMTSECKLTYNGAKKIFGNQNDFNKYQKRSMYLSLRDYTLNSYLYSSNSLL